MQPLPRALLMLSLFIGACDPKSDSASSSAKSSDSSSATTAAAAKKAGPERTAFLMGRKLAFVGAFELTGAKDQSTKAMTEAGAFAKTLGVDPLSGSSMADVELTAAEVKLKHSEKAEATFLFGYYLTDAWFGAELGAKVDVPLEKAAKNAAASGIPEAVWKSKLDAIKADPKGDAIETLAKDIEAHFK